MFVYTFNNDSVIYHSFAVGRGFKEAHVLCHLQYLVIYHTFAVGWGVQGAHGLCHFQNCFSNLPHMCYRQGVRRLMFFATFNNVSVIYHSFAVGRVVFSRPMFIATFNNVSVFLYTCVVVRAFRRLMFYGTFNIQSFTPPLM